MSEGGKTSLAERCQRPFIAQEMQKKISEDAAELLKRCFKSREIIYAGRKNYNRDTEEFGLMNSKLS